jgi:ribosomal 50S subunit-recycling heat shock protein
VSFAFFYFKLNYMRLDLFLKTSRLILRRSLAQEFCDAGAIRVNGAAAKSSKEVKPGDEIEIIRGNNRTKVRVLELPVKKQLAKNEAAGLYTILQQTRTGDPLLP